MAHKDHIFYNFLENITHEDKELMLRSMSSHEIMENCMSEEEFRMITGEDVGEDFPAFRPDRAIDAAPVGDPDVSPERLEKRLEEIKEEFNTKPSMERLKKLAKGPLEPAKSEVSITINIGQLREKAEKLSKS